MTPDSISRAFYRERITALDLILAEHSKLLIESEVHSAESLESRSDVALNVRRRAQADANVGQGLYM